MKNLPFRLRLNVIAILTATLIVSFASAALAQEVIGIARDGQLGMQPAATPVAERMHAFHAQLLWIISGIVLFVALLLVYVMLRFNAKRNPVPSTRTHNWALEIIWTVVPVLILASIVVPSMSLLYYGDRADEPEMTLKVTGYQWYWGYDYPDYEGLSFVSNILPRDKIDSSKGQVNLLSVDNPIILPVDTDIQITVTADATGVIHSFAVPSFGVKTDAVPGRLNESWAHITKPGIYYGQCSELCGNGHAYMPIEVRAVPKDEFKAWAEASKAGYIPYDEFLAGRTSSAQ